MWGGNILFKGWRKEIKKRKRRGEKGRKKL